jgi:hypothetical protein
MRWRYLWWRVRTRLRLLRPSVRRAVFSEFQTAPELHHARHYANAAESAFETLAGYYNDHVEGGFMTVEQAIAIYRKGQQDERRASARSAQD